LLIPHITQIAAVETESGSSFHSYLVPKVPLSESAQQITGILVSDSGPMMVNGEPALHKLMTCTEGFPIVILIAQ